jgi:hypothetical protein
VATFVSGDDLESCTRREPKYGNEGISEPDVVHVIFTCMTGEFACGLVATKEAIENGRFDSRARHNLLWRGDALALRRRFDIAAKKPPGEQPGVISSTAQTDLPSSEAEIAGK